MNRGRRKRIEVAIERIEELSEELRLIAEEERDAIDNLPENMQAGGKADKMEGNASCIEDAQSDLENAKDILISLE